MALVVGTAVASWQAVRAITERDRAVIAEGLANEQLDLVEQQKETITQERDRVTVAELKARKTSYLSDMKLAYRDMSEGRHFNAKQLLNRQIAEGSESDLRGLEWWAAQNLINSQTQVVGQHEGHVRDLAFFSDRTQLASVGEDGFVRIWDLKQRQQLRAFHVSDSPGFSVAVSPDGKWIAYGSGQDEHDRTHVIVVDAQTGEFLAKLNSHPAYIRSIRFSPDGRFLASGSTAHSVCIWKFREGLAGESIEVPADPNPDIHFRLEFLSGGKQLMMEYHNRAGFRVWDVESLTPVIDIRENEIGHSSVWSFHEPTGLLASRMVSSRKEIDLYDTRTKKRFGRKLNPTEFPECLEISPDAKYLCMGGSSGALHFWKLLWGGISDNRSLQAEFVTSVQRHLGAISRIRFVDNETLVSIGRDGRVVLSSLPDKNPATKSLTESVSPVLAVLSPDQKTLLWSGSNRKIYLDDQITGKRIWESEVFPHIPAHLCWAGDSRHLAVITTLGEFSCWRQDEQVFSRYFTGKVDEFHLPEAMVGLALNREGRFLYISGGDGLIPEVRVWDTLEQQEVQHFPTQADPHRLLITPDDRYLIAGYEKLHVFDRMTGFELHQWTVGGVVSSFAHSIEGDVLLAGYEDGVIRFWNYHTGELLKTLSHHRRRVSALALTRDNCTLISGDDEGVVSFWNFETGEHIGNIVDFPGSLDRIQSLLLSSDESYLDLLIGHQLEDRHMERLWLKRESHPE